MQELQLRKRKLYEIIAGDKIITPDIHSETPLIEGIIYPRDYVLLAAEEKVGKTILSQHLTCSLSMGEPLFGVFDIPKKFKTWYLPTEVRVDQLKQRFKRLSGHVGIDTGYIKLIPTKFRFNTEQGIKAMKDIIKELAPEKPDLIVIDAIYKAIRGSLKNDDIVNDFHFIMDWLIEELGCAILLVHHFTKGTQDEQGKRKKERNDKDIFGSTFLGAGVDHIFRLEKWYKEPKLVKDRVLICETQRSDLISDNIRLRLRGPDPLYYEPVSHHFEERQTIVKTFQKHTKLTMQDIEFKSGVGRTKAFMVKKELQKEGKIYPEDPAKKPITWVWNF